MHKPQNVKSSMPGGLLLRNAVIAAAMLISCTAFGEIFSWKHDVSHGSSTPPTAVTWYLFDDPANWAIGTSSDGTNPDNLIPGADDWIQWSSLNKGYMRQSFDLNGKSYTVKGLNDGLGNWGWHHFMLSNGTFTATHSFTNRRVHVRVFKDAKFVHGPNCYSRFGDGAAESVLYVNSGGEMELYGHFYLGMVNATIDTGAKMTLSPTTFAFSVVDQKAYPDWLINNGTLDLPTGLTFSGKSGSWPAPFTITNNVGTMNIGGDMRSTASSDYANLTLAGGTVNVTADASFEGWHELTMPDDATATVNVAAGKTLNFGLMTFGSGTTLVKTGDGALSLAA